MFAYAPELAAAALSQQPDARPVAQTVTFSAAAGSTIVNNNVALSIPPGALAGSGDTVSITLEPVGPSAADPAEPVFAERLFAPAVAVPRGAAKFSWDGTVFRASVADQAGGAVSAFAAPVTIVIKYGPADLAMAGGSVQRLAVAYLVQADTPASVNPDSFPPGSWVFFPPSAVEVESANALITVHTQALGGAVAVFGRPAAPVRSVVPQIGLYSGYDPATSAIFGTRPMWAEFIVVEPQVGERLLVLDPLGGSYAYVNAADVSGPG